MKIPEPRKLKSGKYFIQLRLGGESISVTHLSEKESKRQAGLVKAEYLAGKRMMTKQEAPAAQTLGEAIDRYIKTRDNILSPSTIRGYQTIRNN